LFPPLWEMPLKYLLPNDMSEEPYFPLVLTRLGLISNRPCSRVSAPSDPPSAPRLSRWRLSSASRDLSPPRSRNQTPRALPPSHAASGATRRSATRWPAARSACSPTRSVSIARSSFGLLSFRAPWLTNLPPALSPARRWAARPLTPSSPPAGLTFLSTPSRSPTRRTGSPPLFANTAYLSPSAPHRHTPLHPIARLALRCQRTSPLVVPWSPLSSP